MIETERQHKPAVAGKNVSLIVRGSQINRVSSEIVLFVVWVEPNGETVVVYHHGDLLRVRTEWLTDSGEFTVSHDPVVGLIDWPGSQHYGSLPIMDLSEWDRRLQLDMRHTCMVFMTY